MLGELAQTPVTALFLALSIAVSIYAFTQWKSGRPTDDFVFEPAEAAEGRNRLGVLLSQFSHADPAHLFFNMITLYFFGPVVEHTRQPMGDDWHAAGLGHTGMLIVYVGSALASTALVYARHRHEPGYRALGASGAITGVLFAAIVLDPTMSVSIFIVPIFVPAPIFAILYVLFSIYASKRRLGNIGHDAHLGGAIAGFLLGGLLSAEGFRPLIESLHRLTGR
jgi:membrane associated rhomboid family serine protease